MANRALTLSTAAEFLAPPDRPRNRGPILFGIIVGGLFFGGLGGWAALAPLSSAAVAPGQVKVDSHRKTVQHLEGGIVREILVREGDEVRQGQLLVRLDSTQSGATLDLLRGQHDALKALEARLFAERDGVPRILVPLELTARRDTDPNIAAILAGQETIFASRQAALQGQFDILQQRVEQLRAEIGAYRAQVTSFAKQTALIREEERGIEMLVEKGLEKKPRLLALQREAANLEGNRGQHLGMIAKAERAIGETAMQRADLVNKRQSEVVSELRDTQSKLADVEERLRAAEDIKARTEILAPQSGLVVNLHHFTPGGVIKPGEAILDVVPQDDKLIIEAELAAFDIEGVRPGLPAATRLTAYKQRSTPMLGSIVVYVSADALTNERTGQPYYVVRVEVPAEELARVEGLKLYPGMPAETMIVTGQRTALQYLIDPIGDSFARAFRQK